MTQGPILKTNFFVFDKKGKAQLRSVTLYRSHFEINTEEKVKATVPLSSVVGVKTVNDYELHIFTIRTVPTKKEWKFSHLPTEKTRLKRNVWKLKCAEEDKDQLLIWNHLLLYDILHGLKHVTDTKTKNLELPPTKKYLVIINPVSGKKNAQKHFSEFIKPVLDQSPITYTVVVTKYAGHATNICKTLDPSTVDSIVTIGGDGIIFECIQGIMQNPNQRARSLPFGVVGSGTGNGLATDIGCGHPLAAARVIARGRIRKIDILSCWQNDQVYYSFLSLSFAFIADVDIGSEVLRALGSMRNIVGGLACILRKKMYDAEVKIVPAPPHSFEEQHSVQNESSRHSENSCIIPHLILHYFEKEFKECCPNLSKQFLQEVDNNINFEHKLKRDWISKVSKDDIKSSTDSYLYFLLCNGPHISNDICGSPHAVLDNGKFDLIRVSKCIPRTTLFGMLLKAEDGSYTSISKEGQEDIIIHDQCTAICFRPISNGSYIVLDGEKIEYKPLFVEVHPRLLSFMVDEELDLSIHLQK